MDVAVLVRTVCVSRRMPFVGCLMWDGFAPESSVNVLPSIWWLSVSDGSHSLVSSSSMSWVIIAAFPFAALGDGLGLPRTYFCVGVRGVGGVWRGGLLSMSGGALC